MTPLQVIFIIFGVLIFVAGFDVAKKRKFNALHFLVFLASGAGLLLFTAFPGALDYIGRVFGVARGADVLVYGSIIFLLYFSLLLLNKVEKNGEDTTRLIRSLAIHDAPQQSIKAQTVFVVPGYNEATVIRATIEKLITSKKGLVIAVNDGSRDHSLSILRDLEREHPEDIVVLSHCRNRGQGAALETGFEYVRLFGEKVEYVVTYDADGQHDLADFDEFYKIMESDKSLDIVMGSRFLGKKSSNMPLTRRALLKLGILFTFFISQIRLSDTHNGYRLIRTRALDKIHITLDGMGHASEIIDLVAAYKLKYQEVPVHIHYTDYSMMKGQSSTNAFNVAAKIIWKKFFK